MAQTMFKLYNRDYIIFSSHYQGITGIIDVYSFVERYVHDRENLWLYAVNVGLPQAFFIVDMAISNVRCNVITKTAQVYLEEHNINLVEHVKIVDKFKDKLEDNVKFIHDAHEGVEWLLSHHKHSEFR